MQQLFEHISLGDALLLATLWVAALTYLRTNKRREERWAAWRGKVDEKIGGFITKAEFTETTAGLRTTIEDRANIRERALIELSTKMEAQTENQDAHERRTDDRFQKHEQRFDLRLTELKADLGKRLDNISQAVSGPRSFFGRW